MSAYTLNTITNEGNRCLIEYLVGERSIRFTNLRVGSGELPEGLSEEERTEYVRNLTDMIHTEATFAVVKHEKVSDTAALVGGSFINTETDTPFKLREIGLYCLDPRDDETEILYCYGNSLDMADDIPPDTPDATIQKSLDIITTLSPTAHVDLSVNLQGYVTLEMYLSLAERVEKYRQACEECCRELRQLVEKAQNRADDAWDEAQIPRGPVYNIDLQLALENQGSGAGGAFLEGEVANIKAIVTNNSTVDIEDAQIRVIPATNVELSDA